MCELSFAAWIGLGVLAVGLIILGLLLLWRLECSSRSGRVCADDGVITIRIEVG